MLVQTEERAVTEQVHRVVHVGFGVLVEHRLGVEQRLVPGDADGQIAHRQCDVGERGEGRHDAFPSVVGECGESGWMSLSD